MATRGRCYRTSTNQNSDGTFDINWDFGMVTTRKVRAEIRDLDVRMRLDYVKRILTDENVVAMWSQREFRSCFG